MTLVACGSSGEGPTPSASSSAAPPRASTTASASAGASSAAAPASASAHAVGVVPIEPTPAVVREPDGPAAIAWLPHGLGFLAIANGKLTIHSLVGAAPIPIDGPQPIVAMEVSLRGDRVGTVDAGGRVRVFELPSGKLSAELPGEVPGVVLDATFSPTGKLLAVSTESAAVIWNVEKKARNCALAEGYHHDLAFTDDEGSLVTTGLGWMGRYDVVTCAEQAANQADTGGTFGSWVAPKGRFVAAAGGAGHDLKLYGGRDLALIDTMAKSAGCEDHVAAAFSRDGEVLLGMGGYHWLRSVRLDSRKSIAAFDIPRPDEVTYAVPFDDGERIFLARGAKGEIWSAVSKELGVRVELEDAARFDVSWNMQRLLGASATYAYVWSTATGALENKIALGPGK